mmetsp:Transcript_13324/g.42262  ORF Transcript_13324/g.42262 Transcript_13324/m.42262 type:complete len:200 (-) Transcript_13324:275-874(-)
MSQIKPKSTTRFMKKRPLSAGTRMNATSKGVTTAVNATSAAMMSSQFFMNFPRGLMMYAWAKYPVLSSIRRAPPDGRRSRTSSPCSLPATLAKDSDAAWPILPSLSGDLSPGGCGGVGEPRESLSLNSETLAWLGEESTAPICCSVTSEPLAATVNPSGTTWFLGPPAYASLSSCLGVSRDGIRSPSPSSSAPSSPSTR